MGGRGVERNLGIPACHLHIVNHLLVLEEGRDLCGNKTESWWVHTGSTYTKVRKIWFASTCPVCVTLGKYLTLFDSISLGVKCNDYIKPV